MYCKKCGAQIQEDSIFCCECGTSAVNPCSTATMEPKIDSETKTVEFIRHKSLGKLDISHIISVVQVHGHTLKLTQQKVVFYFFKKAPIETTHNIHDIASMKIKKSLDASDILFSLIFAALGFVNPILFLVAIVLLWIGIGRKIEITKSNGSTIIIPAENDKQWPLMLETFCAVNNGIAVQQK